MARKSDAYGRPKRRRSQIRPPRYRRRSTAPAEREPADIGESVNRFIEPWEIVLLLFIAIGVVCKLIDVFMPK